MAVTLRLARHGGRQKPFFHLVATDSRNARDGRFTELVGTYDPRKGDVRLQRERIGYWLSKGATTSATVKQLLKKAGPAPAKA